MTFRIQASKIVVWIRKYVKYTAILILLTYF